MSIFFLVLEAFIYGFAFYLMVNKKELGVLYLPVLFFAFSALSPTQLYVPLALFYGVIGAYILSLLLKNKYALIKENPFAILLFIYFIILLFQASATIKYSLVYSALVFFISLPLIPFIYREYSKEQIIAELTNSALLILLIFIANVVFSSVTKFAPTALYGFSKGVLYGYLTNTHFNVIAIALFIVLLAILRKSNALLIGVYIISLGFLILTLRRSATLAGLMGIPIALITMLTQNAIRKVLGFVVLSCMVGSIIYYNSSFVSSFEERYQMRNLDDRAIDEEKRFIEYELLYNDMFELKEYSPWFGFGLFDSAGNYGRGVFFDRSLHGDLPSIAHSSGLLGVFLYLLMIITAFSKALKASKTKSDKIIVLYCILVFLIYTTTGRFTEASCMLLLFFICNIGQAESEHELEQQVTIIKEEVPSSSYALKQLQG
ncbi:MAG TPA: O-antigen ligase family protein [Flavisolibacter sp.]|nr:O-antigen ligase family protein [Flavisolibacter sp.]